MAVDAIFAMRSCRAIAVFGGAVTKMNMVTEKPVNPALARLGFGDTDKVVILHVDDVGMCGASLDAFADLWERKSVTCGSVMVPCPWFRATAAWARENPDADLGVHATLTSEWPGYRWGPVSTRDPSSGLMDKERAFHRTSEEVAARADAFAAKVELRMQIAMAREAGIVATHLDTHMGSVMHERLYPNFVAAALDAGLAPFALRFDETQWSPALYSPKTIAVLTENARDLEKRGIPAFDRLFQLSLSIEDDRPARTREMIDKVRPGQIAYALFHPALDTAELRSICPDWRSRVADYELLASGELRGHLEDQGMKVIGCRELQAIMPARN
jgi:predicted glycoside hydrolase/deacetylase ChbG (UPF0249 family)